MVSQQYTPLPEGWQCKGLVMHFAPHFDEILAAWILYYFDHVGQKYPGASRAEHRVRNEQEEMRNGEEVLLRDGYIPLGWGYGRFDEHPDPEHSILRKEDQCCATLVAEDLGVREHSCLKGMLDYSLGDDIEGGSNKRHIPYVIQVFHRQKVEYQVVMQWVYDAIHVKYWDAHRSGSSGNDWSIETIAKLMAEQYPDEPSKAEAWFILGADALAEQERRFREVTALEYEFIRAHTPVKTFIRIGKKGKLKGRSIPLSIVYADTSDDQMGNYIRYKGAAVAIIRNLVGQVQILLNKDCVRYGLRFDKFIRTLRLEEQKAAGRVTETRSHVLSKEGMLSSDNRWHWFPKAQVILNGGFTAPHVEPTRLSIEYIAELIREAFDQSAEVV
ncbi:MAG: hypothetical protein WAU28_03515 [Candidatus Moraniibacteriota bacterium]